MWIADSSRRKSGRRCSRISGAYRRSAWILKQADVMNWLAWLGLAVVIAAVAAVTGIKPKGTRPVAHSRMMAMARLALLAIVVIPACVSFRAPFSQC